MAATRSLTQRLLARLAELSDHELDELAARSLELKADRGDAGARHCARVFAGLRLGAAVRIDDTALLAEVDELIQAGRGSAAVGIVARKHGGWPAEVDAIARRLRRKRADKKNGQRGVSAPAVR